MPFPYPVAPLILSHHERWDGKGYPHGLSGDDIPLGARILTIADYFDAVTTERPYHKALTTDAAVTLIQHEAGRALDPSLAATFVRILPRLLAQAAEIEPTVPAPTAHAPAADPTVPAPAGAVNATLENITRAHREIYALYEIAQSMGTSLGVADTMALLSAKLSKVVPWTACALFLYQPDRDTLKCRYTNGAGVQPLRDAEIPSTQGLPGWVARNRVTVTSSTAYLPFDATGVPSDVELNSAIVCPLNVGDTFIGCLALYHTERDRYTEDHSRLLEQVAEQAGSVVQNSVVFEQTQQDSLTDSLTTLPNRRSLFTYLARELARGERLTSELAVIVLDIDGFKAINDTHGHHTGDRALRAVAAAIKGGLRSYDLCVRYAGDEFVLVLLGCSAAGAASKTRELQRRIGKLEVDLRFGQTLRLSASAGAAVYPGDGATAEALLTRADARMYDDKAARRGRRPEPAASPRLLSAGSAAAAADDTPRLKADLVKDGQVLAAR